MNVLVVTPVFSIAGVPLAQVRFARALAARGHRVTLMIGHIDRGHVLPELPDINVIDLKQRQVRGMFVPLCRYLLAYRPEVVFSAEDHLNCTVLLAMIVTGSRARVSCSSRVTPFDTYSNTLLSKRWILKQLMRAVMWRANALTCVSRDMVEQYRSVFRKPRHVCVYNIVDDQQSRRRMQEPVDHEWFVERDTPLLIAAGRLAPWKGFSDLIRAMALVSPATGARLLVLGDGPLRGELQSLVEQLGLQQVVRLEGYVENPLKYFKKADVFVLSSLVEGLPNVLVEAMMCGCTPVSTDCPTGPREVLDEGRLGYLVPVRNPVALAAGICRALDEPIPGELLREAVRPFEENAVIDRHFHLLGLQAREGLAGALS